MARPLSHDTALRDRLLTVTAQLVDAEGPQGVSLREVASAADTSTTAVYSLFGGKAELLSAVIDHGFASFGASQASAESEGLRALGIAYRDWALRNPALYRLMFGANSIADCTPDPKAAENTLMPLARAVAGGRDAHSPEVLFDAVRIWAQVHGAVSLELTGMTPPELDWTTIYTAILDQINDAIIEARR